MQTEDAVQGPKDCMKMRDKYCRNRTMDACFL